MQFTWNVDLGQLIIGGLITAVGFFVKRTIDDFGKRIDKHEDILFKMAQDVQYIIGFLGIEKRTFPKTDRQ